MRKVIAVTFDLWDTLIKEVPGGSERVGSLRIHGIADLLERIGRPHDIDEIEERHLQAVDQAIADQVIKASVTEDVNKKLKKQKEKNKLPLLFACFWFNTQLSFYYPLFRQ